VPESFGCHCEERSDEAISNKEEHNMKNKLLSKGLILVFLLFAVFTVVHAGTGTTGAQFLKISPAARPTAMGNAFVGLADDVNAIYYNPAGLSFISGGEVMLMHNQWFEEINVEHLAYAQNMEDIGSIGVAGTLTSAGDIDKFDNAGVDLDTTYTANDTMFLVAYSRLLGGGEIAVGGDIKIIQQQIEEEQAQGFAVDLGVMYQPLHIGVVIQNIGAPMKFISEGDPLPANLRLGTGQNLLDGNLNLVGDLRYYFDGQSSIGLGAEYIYDMENITLAIRTGYDTFYSNIGGLAGFSLGFGGYMGPCKIDIVWCPYGEDFGDTYRIGFTFNWGKEDNL
jgi:hypothetical protein